MLLSKVSTNRPIDEGMSSGVGTHNSQCGSHSAPGLAHFSVIRKTGPMQESIDLPLLPTMSWRSLGERLHQAHQMMSLAEPPEATNPEYIADVKKATGFDMTSLEPVLVSCIRTALESGAGLATSSGTKRTVESLTETVSSALDDVVREQASDDFDMRSACRPLFKFYREVAERALTVADVFSGDGDQNDRLHIFSAAALASALVSQLATSEGPNPVGVGGLPPRLYVANSLAWRTLATASFRHVAEKAGGTRDEVGFYANEFATDEVIEFVERMFSDREFRNGPHISPDH